MLKQIYTSLYTRLSDPMHDYNWYIDHLNSITLSQKELKTRNRYLTYLFDIISYDKVNFCLWYEADRLYLLIYPFQSNRIDFVSRVITNTLYFVFHCENISNVESKSFYFFIQKLITPSSIVYDQLLQYGEQLLRKSKDSNVEIPNVIDFLNPSSQQTIPTIKEFAQNIDFKHSSFAGVQCIEHELFTVLQQLRTEDIDEYTHSYGLLFSPKIKVQQAYELCRIDLYTTKWRIYSESQEVFGKSAFLYIKDDSLWLKKIKSQIKAWKSKL